MAAIYIYGCYVKSTAEMCAESQSLLVHVLCFTIPWLFIPCVCKYVYTYGAVYV